MSSAIIYFADKSTIELNDGDRIIPIIECRDEDKPFPSVGSPIKIYEHSRDGLIPSILEALYRCKFFFICYDSEVAYNVSSIIKIENR